MTEDKWLTVEEICNYLSVTKDTIYKWIDQRDMPAHRVGRRWMFQKKDVDGWIKAGKAADTK
ncbi:transcriptional regulator, AlpA family [Epsilonproteobacteria bacterium SCGC AD-308-P11]|jgi:excisionase family DNA binding protein|nr:transcriptional regulator, AlpA family [Epsilonproteobacteria bacterium SCGC AD-308-P11]